MYYRGSQAAIVVYDLTNLTSFERAKDWVRELQQQGDPNIVVAFVGNKIDMEHNRKVTALEAAKYAEDNHLFAMEVSAKSAIGIQELFMKIGKKTFLNSFNRNS
jgi:Ras-related protein Rab-5C